MRQSTQFHFFHTVWARLALSFPSVMGLLLLVAASNSAKAESQAPGLGDPGTLQRLLLENRRVVDGRFELVGRDAQQQLVIAGEYSSGQFRDLSRQVRFSVQPAGIVSISADGLVEPEAEGEARISVTHALGHSVEVTAVVKRLADDLPINFPNQVTPIFSKLGCNTGGCHGKADGKNGFKLSLFGFEPTEDYEHLVKEGRGRRIFPAAPERSLLLLKATNVVPHGGGAKMEEDSYNYRVLHRWIKQGMP
jgi:hypothetical protein